MKNWIWHQKYSANEAVDVSPYFNINHESEISNKIFVSQFDGKGPFMRGNKNKKVKIGFIK